MAAVSEVSKSLFAKNRIEAFYLTKEPKNNLYIMFSNVDINWIWDRQDVKEFDRSIKAGMNLFELQEKFNRTQEEIVLMTIDRDLRIKEVADDKNTPYIMLENVEINWFWDFNEAVMFDVYHNTGMNIQWLATKFDRTEAEVIIMIFDRALQGKLQ